MWPKTRPELTIYLPRVRFYILQQHDGATSGAGTTYPSGAPEFTPVFSGVRVTRFLILCVWFVDRCLSFCTFSSGHCVVCSSSIYGFWLPLWYYQTLLNTSTTLIYAHYRFLSPSVRRNFVFYQVFWTFPFMYNIQSHLF